MVPLGELRGRAVAFEEEAQKILGRHEGGQARVITLHETWRRLDDLSLRQHDLLREALQAVERGLYRSAHVMAWAAFADLLGERLASDGFAALHSAWPNWKQWKTLEELVQDVPESQLIDAGRKVRLLTKPDAKALHGLLSRRNECAHPSPYTPERNQTLGYVSEILDRMKKLRSKSPRT